jgi:hypothetical protein
VGTSLGGRKRERCVPSTASVVVSLHSTASRDLVPVRSGEELQVASTSMTIRKQIYAARPRAGSLRDVPSRSPVPSRERLDPRPAMLGVPCAKNRIGFTTSS